MTVKPARSSAAAMMSGAHRKLRACLLFLIGIIVPVCAHGGGSLLFVDANAMGEPEDGSTWNQAFRSVQGALDAAQAGDSIWVAAGTYGEAVSLLPDVRLLGGFAVGDDSEDDRLPNANLTTLDATSVVGPRHVVTGAAGAELSGFTLTGGDAFTDFLTPDGIYGGGLYLSSGQMEISECLFTENRAAERGGGAYITGASAVFVDCTFLQNEATVAGGGLASLNATVTLTRCGIISNEAGGGPGVFISAGVGNFDRVLFQRNTGGLGGGIYALSANQTTLLNCIFDSNSAVNGGAIYTSSATVMARFTTLSGNRASSGGGAVSNFGSTAISDSILWDNGASPIQNAGISLVIDSSIVEGGFAGAGNQDTDPKFRLVSDPAPFALTASSPARDASAGIPPATDFAGQPRTGSSVDIGALEFGVDTDGGGLPDSYELANNFSVEDDSDDGLDSDEDGLDNLEEFRRGSDPNDENDPQSIFFVSAMNGNDELGDGSPDMPWATIPFAFTQIPEGTPSFKVTVVLAPGVYAGPLTLPSHVALGGATPADRENVRLIHRENSLNFTIITGAGGACLQHCTVAVDGSVLGNVELLRIENVSMEVRHVTFDGLLNADAVGVTVAGTASSNTVIRDCTVRRVREGIRAVNSGATITRCLFDRIQGTALLVELPEKGSEQSTPLLGDTDQGEDTGFNQFRDVTGMFIDYTTPSDAATLAQFNDWGLDDPAAIMERVSTQVVIEPIVAKRIGVGTVVVDTLDQGSGQQIPYATTATVLLDQTVQTQRDSQSLLFVFDAVPAGMHTVGATVAGYGTGDAAVNTQALSIDYLALNLQRQALPEDIDGVNGVDAVDVQLAILGALGIPTGHDTDVNDSGDTDAIDVQLVIIAALTR